MDLPAQAKAVYTFWWSLVVDAASKINAVTGRISTATDLTAAAASYARQHGQTLAFDDLTGLAQLYGVARTMERAADTLTAAPDEVSIDGSMVSEPPWSRALSVQTAAPKWQLRAEITYRAPDGTIVTDWGTGVFHNVLPPSVGAMRAEALLQFQRMLSQRSEQRNTGGELLAIGRTYLLAV